MDLSYRGAEDGFTEIYRREIGLSHPRNVARRFSASEALVKRIMLYKKLDSHEGCVNAVEFNSTGDLLVSGYDDGQVIFWNWANGSEKFSYSSGHLDNIFQARIMPYTDDQCILTSAADGQVRLGLVMEGGQVETKCLGKHQGCVYKLAVEPGSPHVFYSCGEDGLVQHFDLRSSTAARLFYCSSFTQHDKQPLAVIGLNAIVIDPRNPCYFAVGGSDEYARVYDIRKCNWDASTNSGDPVDTFCPAKLIERNYVQITGLAFSRSNELLISYSDELIYLFEKNKGLGPSPLSTRPKEGLQKLESCVYVGHRNSQTVKGVSFFGPNDEYVLSGSDCGHIFIWATKGGKLVRMMVGHRVNQLEPHPHLPIFATCGLKKSVKLWSPMATDVPPLPEHFKKIMEVNRQQREDILNYFQEAFCFSVSNFIRARGQ